MDEHQRAQYWEARDILVSAVALQEKLRISRLERTDEETTLIVVLEYAIAALTTLRQEMERELTEALELEGSS